MADVLVVGAGAAGVACVTELAAGGFDGSIVLAGREPDPPYERPPISKGYLAGSLDRADVAMNVPEGVDLRVRASVMKLDLERRIALLASKEEIPFGSLVLCTGANVRRLRVDGAALEGIHYLRALGNADALRADLEGRSRVVLVGGSYIACEVAATLTSLGKSCTMVMLEELPMITSFGPVVGSWALSELRSHGVELICGDGLAGFVGSERVSGVVTEGGRSVDADAVVMGTGAVPDVMIARSAGLSLGDGGGVACSSSLETSAAGVWCAGDVCEYDSVLHGGPVRIEHWEAARAQGTHVARAIMGFTEPFAEVPYFWTDLSDWATLEYAGISSVWAHEVVRGMPGDGPFAVLHLDDADRVVGCLSMGRGDDLAAARRLIADRVDVAGADLATADLSAL